MAEIQNFESEFVIDGDITPEMEFLKFFDPVTMSIHLKENQKPLGKKGKPGSFELVELDSKTLDKNYLELIINQILSAIDDESLGNTEISKPGALVIQYRDYRIAITRPPFSELLEITIVHPIKQMSLEDYHLSEKLMSRLQQQAEGILISGAPGSGKSTLASGIANFFNQNGKIVKTFESPRDLQVDSGVTQYTRLDGSFENSADVLLLVRPDYTIFDEVRRREDFKIFSDLRLTGVGMVGVVHANTPIDAIQRFIGKIELGIIPNVLDTVIFVKDGEISKVYYLELKVKVPSGMIEQDLARPVIEISDFETKNLEYEIYTFGEENIIIPVEKLGSQKSGIEHLAEERILEHLYRFDSHPKIEFQGPGRIKVFVASDSIPSLIGKAGKNIQELEKILGLHIDVEENSIQRELPSMSLPYDFSESRTSFIFETDREFTGNIANFVVNDEFLFSSKIGKRGKIKVLKRSTEGKRFSRFVGNTDSLEIFLKQN